MSLIKMVMVSYNFIERKMKFCFRVRMNLLLLLGELSIFEIKSAINKILKSELSEAEAEEIVNMLDTDSDGKISVIEFLQFVEARKKKVEVEHLEVS